MGGAIALEFDPSHQHRLHGHQLARNDISTALVDEFDLARLFDHHPTVTPMSLYHVLAHKLDVYCATLLLPSQRNLVAQQSTRQRLSALNAALQSRGLITLFPGYDDDGGGGKDSPTTSATSEVSATVREDSAEAHIGSPGKPKSEFHRVDDARCVVLFLTADYLAALQPAPPAAHDAQHNTIATDAAENSLNTLMSSEHGTMRSSAEPRAHSPAPHHSIHPSPSDLHLNALADEDVRARDRCHREFLYIQRSLPATKIVPVVVDAAAAHVADWPLPLQRLYYPHLFLHQSSGLGGGAANGPTPEYFQHHPLTHLVQCPAHELPSSSSSSSLFAALHPPHDSASTPPPSGLASAASFSLLRSASHHASAASSAQVERLFDTVLRVVKIPLRPLIQEEMDRVLARSASLPSSVKLAMGELSSLANGDHSVLSNSSRNSSRPQSSSRRSFTLPALSPTASQSRVGGDAAALHLDGRSQSPLPGGGALPASTPLVSSVIHFFVVEGRIAPAKAREYALIMAQQDHLESVPALKHHIQHHHADYLQMRLGMTELEAKRMLQLLLQATGDVLEVRRRRSLGGGEISSTMMTNISNAAAAQLHSAADSAAAPLPHGASPGPGGEHSDNDDDHTVNSASQRSDSRKGGGLGGARLGSGKSGSGKLAARGGSSVGSSGGSNKQAQRRRSDGGSYFFDPTAAVEGGHSGGGGSMVQMVMSRVSSLMTASASQPSVQPPRSRSHSPSLGAAAADDASSSASGGGGSAKQAAVAAPAEEK